MKIEPKKILCAIDFSDFTNTILSYGKSMAAQFNSKLYVCHVLPGSIIVSSHMPAYIDYTEIDQERMTIYHEKLQKLVDELDINCEILISCGHPAEEIQNAAKENNIDMVIAATHGGSGIKRFLIGSVTNRLMKVLTCPLLVLHTHEKHLPSKVDGPIKLKKILIGCDFSPDSQLAFDYATSLAQEFQAQLFLVHVIKHLEHAHHTQQFIKEQAGEFLSWDNAKFLEMQKKDREVDTKINDDILNRIETQLFSMLPEDSKNWCTPVTALLEGEPYQELVNYANIKEMDMIILGIRGHSLLEDFLIGSTTDRVVSRASCPVLTIRHIKDS